MKKEKGITLIALVITVIVLLILAGVAVSIGLNGDNLFSKANEAKTEWNMDVITEDTKMSELQNILNEIANVNPTTYTVYSLGQEVTLGGEQFFVIEENDTASKDTIKLITKYNLDLSTNNQMNATWTATGTPFCTSSNDGYYGKGYWYEPEENEDSKYPLELNGDISNTQEAIVYNKAATYGQSKGGTGRLLTLEEANSLTASGKIPKIVYGQDYSVNPAMDGNLMYWLSTAASGFTVFVVSGSTGYTFPTGYDGDIYEREEFYGIRPVVIIQKSFL